jgi:hypothetical protein
MPQVEEPQATAEELYTAIYENFQLRESDPDLWDARVEEVKAALEACKPLADWLSSPSAIVKADLPDDPGGFQRGLFIMGVQAGLAIARRRAELEELARLATA